MGQFIIERPSMLSLNLKGGLGLSSSNIIIEPPSQFPYLVTEKLAILDNFATK